MGSDYESPSHIKNIHSQSNRECDLSEDEACRESCDSDSTGIHDAHLTTDGEIDNRDSSKK